MCTGAKILLRRKRKRSGYDTSQEDLHYTPVYVTYVIIVVTPRPGTDTFFTPKKISRINPRKRK